MIGSDAQIWLLSIAIGSLPFVVALAAHIGARLDWHRKLVKVRRQDLSALGIWGKANPWRIILHNDLSPAAERSVSAHEWQHVCDYWLCGLYGFAIWKLIRKRAATLWIESRAYAESVNHGRNLEDAARVLAGQHYNLGITKTEARREIQSWRTSP